MSLDHGFDDPRFATASADARGYGPNLTSIAVTGRPARGIADKPGDLGPTEPPFPTRVRVGYRIYAIEVWETRAARASQRLAELSHGERLIRVSREYGPHDTSESLLHEIMHAVAIQAEHSEVNHPSEEFLVATGAKVLTQVLIDSPELRAWLTWAWAQEA